MPALMSLFGPSRTDKLLDVLREDRAAMQAQHAATLALMTKLVEGVTAQADLAKQQLELLTADPGTPSRVRLMTRPEEAHYERLRNVAAVQGTATVGTDTLLAALERDFAATAQNGF